MQLQLIRSATLVVAMAGKAILFDPMLSPAGAMDPLANTPNPRRNPLVELPFDDAELDRLLARIDAVLVTHTHRDHWDARAAELIPKQTPILCQPEDEARIRGDGFGDVQPVVDALTWDGIELTRTGGHHGTGEIGRLLAPVSGFVLRAAGEPTLYLAGDTIWCPEVAAALDHHRPDVTVVHAGGARFLTGDPIVMTADDVVQVCQALPTTRVIAVHLEAMNHCLLSRVELRESLQAAGVLEQVSIPADGEMVEAHRPTTKATR